MVGLDYSAAFDCANHEALIFKLKQLSLGGTFLSIYLDPVFNWQSAQRWC